VRFCGDKNGAELFQHGRIVKTQRPALLRGIVYIENSQIDGGGRATLFGFGFAFQRCGPEPCPGV
jgi:hypothetical protein